MGLSIVQQPAKPLWSAATFAAFTRGGSTPRFSFAEQRLRQVAAEQSADRSAHSKKADYLSRATFALRTVFPDLMNR